MLGIVVAARKTEQGLTTTKSGTLTKTKTIQMDLTEIDLQIMIRMTTTMAQLPKNNINDKIRPSLTSLRITAIDSNSKAKTMMKMGATSKEDP